MTENDFNKYIAKCQVFSGRMDMMGNSIDLVISGILEKLGHDLNRLTLGPKIGKFKRSKPQLSNIYSGDLDRLNDGLDKFNKNWIVTKHGTVVGGATSITFQKNESLFVFDPKKISKIEGDFTETILELNKILNAISAEGTQKKITK